MERKKWNSIIVILDRNFVSKIIFNYKIFIFYYCSCHKSLLQKQENWGKNLQNGGKNRNKIIVIFIGNYVSKISFNYEIFIVVITLNILVYE